MSDERHINPWKIGIVAVAVVALLGLLGWRGYQWYAGKPVPSDAATMTKRGTVCNATWSERWGIHEGAPILWNPSFTRIPQGSAQQNLVLVICHGVTGDPVGTLAVTAPDGTVVWQETDAEPYPEAEGYYAYLFIPEFTAEQAGVYRVTLTIGGEVATEVHWHSDPPEGTSPAGAR